MNVDMPIDELSLEDDLISEPFERSHEANQNRRNQIERLLSMHNRQTRALRNNENTNVLSNDQNNSNMRILRSLVGGSLNDSQDRGNALE